MRLPARQPGERSRWRGESQGLRQRRPREPRRPEWVLLRRARRWQICGRALLAARRQESAPSEQSSRGGWQMRGLLGMCVAIVGLAQIATAAAAEQDNL